MFQQYSVFFIRIIRLYFMVSFGLFRKNYSVLFLNASDWIFMMDIKNPFGSNTSVVAHCSNTYRCYLPVLTGLGEEQ